jgi:hypothetical protein
MKASINGVLMNSAIQITENHFTIVFDFAADVYIGGEVCCLLNNTLEQLSKTKVSNQGTIKLVIYPSNQQIDLSIFGLLCLIKSKCPAVGIVFDLRKLEDDTQHGLSFKIRQYCTASYLFFDKIILEIQYKSGLFNIENVSSKEYWLLISSKFIPVFKIDDAFNKTGFLEPPSEDAISAIFGAAKTINTDKVANKLLLHLGLSVSFTQYYLLCLIDALEYLRISHYFIQDYADRKISKNISSKLWIKIAGDPYKDYYKPVSNILYKVLHQPGLLILIFSRLVANIIPEYTNRPTDRGVTFNSLALKIEEIYNISYTIFGGLREIAGNIIEHSSERSGLLLARIFKLDELIAFKKLSFPGFESYGKRLEAQSSDQQYLLDITVLDSSTIGIVESFSCRTKQQQKKALASIVPEQPSVWIADRKILDDFFSYPNAGLGHEIFQVIANAGLIVFNKNVEQMQGFFFVSSPSKDVLPIDVFNNQQLAGISLNKGFYSAGTHYNIVFPLFRKAAAATELIHVLSHSTWNNYSENNSILDYSYIRPGNTPITPMALLEVVIEHKPIDIHDKYSQEIEIVQEVVNKTKRYEASSVIPVIHLGNSGLQHAGPGHLIRILAGIKYKTTFKDIVVMGCPIESVMEVFELLRTNEKRFWSDSYCVVFYVSSDNHYLPITLFCNSYEECIRLNHLSNDILIGNEIPEVDFPNVSGSRLFDHADEKQARMVEIDTVIEVEGLTLFEHYAKACLLKELND